MSDAVWNLFFFIIVIGVLVTIHELGHFIVARLCGVKVYRFSIGFGPVLYSRTAKDGTEYAISLIPLGGYVKMKGEADDPLQRHNADKDQSEDSQESTDKSTLQTNSRTFAQTDFAEFRSGYEGDDCFKEDAGKQGAGADNKRSDSIAEQSCFRRFLIMFAGPFANILLAFILFVLVNLIGVSVYKPVIGDLLPGSMAEQAGLKTFDLVQKVGDQEVYDWNEVMSEFIAHASEPITLTVSSNKGTGPSREIYLDFTNNDFSPDVSPFKFLGFNPSYGKISHALKMVLEDGVAFKQGLQVGDRIFAVDGQLTSNWVSLQQHIDREENANRTLTFSLLRKKGTPIVNQKAPLTKQESYVMVNGYEMDIYQLFDYLRQNKPNDTLTLELQNNTPDEFEILSISLVPEVVIDADSGKKNIRVGIGTDVEPDPSLETVRQYGLGESLILAAQTTARTSMLVLTAIKKMIVGDISARNVSGPISIAKGAGMTAAIGVVPFLLFMATISINLGVFNLLPVPLLDGGQIIYVIYEGITGRRPNARMQNILTLISLSLLLSLMIFSLFNDLSFL